MTKAGGRNAARFFVSGDDDSMGHPAETAEIAFPRSEFFAAAGKSDPSPTTRHDTSNL